MLQTVIFTSTQEENFHDRVLRLYIQQLALMTATWPYHLMSPEDVQEKGCRTFSVSESIMQTKGSQ